MERWNNRVAVVTGASSGIGAALAKDLVNAGLVVVATGRRVELIEDLRKTLPVNLQAKFHPKKLDVTNEQEVRQVFEWVESTLGGTDILVNNAGCARMGQLCQARTQGIRDVINTNVMGAVYCTQEAFKSMKARKFGGHVVIMNSILGHNAGALGPGVPDVGAYPPSKYALTAMTELYRQEFLALGTRIKITSISPGPTDTAIIPDNLRALVGDNFLSPEDVSNAVMYAISTPPHVQIHELIIQPIPKIE